MFFKKEEKPTQVWSMRMVVTSSGHSLCFHRNNNKRKKKKHVGMYRKSYCTPPGDGVGSVVAFSKMLFYRVL